MARYRGPRVVIQPPPKPTPPASTEPKQEEATVLDFLLKVAAAVVFVAGVGAIVKWLDGIGRPPPGWVCTETTRRTANDTQHGRYCDPMPNWHAIRLPDGSAVAVPAERPEARRYPIWDDR